MITSDQVDSSPLGLYFISILVHVAAKYTHIYKLKSIVIVFSYTNYGHSSLCYR